MSAQPAALAALLALVMVCCRDAPHSVARRGAAPSLPVASPSASTPTQRSVRPPQSVEADRVPLFRMPVPPLARDAPARRYVAMSARECYRRSHEKGLPIAPTKKRHPGVRAPVRWIGPSNGITIEAPGPNSPFGILDCRLAFAIAEMTLALRALGVTRLRVDSMYRNGARISGKKGQPSQHAAGLAVDILSMTIDGTEVDVKTGWNGELGSPPCGPMSRILGSAESSVLLRNAVCEIARRGLFHHMITPNRNAAHDDHLHFDLEAGERSLLLE